MSRATSEHRQHLGLLCVLVGGVLVASLAPGIHRTSASESVTPTPIPTLTPTQQRAEQVLRAFYAAYNRRDVPAIFALLPSDLRYYDCDYTHHRSVAVQSKPALRHWLRDRFREHDRFVVVGPLSANPGPGKVAAGGDVIRHSDALDPLVDR